MKHLIALLFISFINPAIAQVDFITISNNGKYLITQHSNERYYRLYNIKENRLIDTFFMFNYDRTSFSNNSKYFAFIDTLKHLTIYVVEEKRCYKVCKPISISEENFRFSENDSFLFSSYFLQGHGYGGGIYDVYYENYLLPDKIKGFQLNPCSSWDGNVSTCTNLKNRKCVGFRYDFEEKKSVVANSKIANNDSYYLNKESTYKYFNFTPLFFQVDLIKNKTEPQEFYVSPYVTESNNGDYLFITYLNHTNSGLIIDSKNLNIVSEVKGNGLLRDIAFSNDDKQLLTLNTNKRLSLWDVKSGKLIAEMDRKLVMPQSIDSISINFGFLSNGKKHYIFYENFCCETNGYQIKKNCLLDRRNLNIKLKLADNELPLRNYLIYRNNKRKQYNSGKYIKPVDYFITGKYLQNWKLESMNVYDGNSFKLLKRINNSRIKKYKSKSYYCEEFEYLNKHIFISESQILETDWSIIDFLETLVKEKTLKKD